MSSGRCPASGRCSGASRGTSRANGCTRPATTITTAPSTNEATLSAGHFDNGKLVSDGQWAFDKTRPDKSVEGCVVFLPDWFVLAHPSLTGKRLGAGCGGYRSVVAIGPAFMGAALAAFAPPVSGPIPSVPLVGYPFANSILAGRMHRDTNYINDFGGDSAFPRIPSLIGYTTWADWCAQCGTWIDTPGLSGFVMLWQRGIGRVWYTNTINASGWEYDLVVYSPEDLGKVADGAPQSSIQPVLDVPFAMPGIPQPNAGGHDNPPHVITGIAFEPVTRTLVIGVKGGFGIDASTMATAYLFYRVVDPLKPFTVVRTREMTDTVTVQAITEDDALQQAKQTPDGSWHPTTDATSYTVPKYRDGRSSTPHEATWRSSSGSSPRRAGSTSSAGTTTCGQARAIRSSG
jgi:hypothetical protein